MEKMRLIKKIAAGALGLLMVGSSVAFAQLEDFPSPFVTDSGVQSLIVVGANAAPSDVIAAVDIAARLGGEVKTTVSCPGTSASISVSGEGKEVATTNTKLYLNDTIRKTGARTTFTSNELPTVLASGTLEDTDASTTYDYDQYIDLSDDYYIKFGQYTGSDLVTGDPEIIIDHTSGTNPSTPSTSSYMYRARAVFEKGVNGTTAIGEKLTLFGKEYTISSSTTFTSSSPKLVLFGSSSTQVLTEGEPVTVTIDGTEYEVTLKGVADQDTAVINVKSGTTEDQKQFDTGNTVTIAGLKVYLDSVYYYGSTRTDNQVKVGLGATELTFEDGKKVTTGSSGSTTNIDGTYVDLTTSNGKLDMLEVYIAPPKTAQDALKKGESFTDPVFGSFSLDFVSVSPELTDSSRSTLEIANSGDDSLTATFTDSRGNTKTFTWAYDADNIVLADGSGYPYVVTEGQAVYQNWYVVVNAGGFSHILQLSDLDNDGTTTSSVEFTDIFSGTTYTFTLGTDNQTTAYIDGQAYYIDGSASTDYVTITWGDGAGYSDVGDEWTIYPTIKGKNGEYIALANATIINTTATNGKTLVFPTGKVSSSVSGDYINLTAYSGYNLLTSGGSSYLEINKTAGGVGAIKVGKTSTGGFYYNITVVNDTMTIKPAGSTAASYDGTSNQADEAIILVEEQDSENNVYSVAVPAANETSGSTVQIIAGTPDFTYDEHSASLKSDTYKTQYVDLYGTFAEKNTYGQDTVKIWYPDEQMTVNLVVLGEDATVSTSGATSGTTVEQAVPVTTALGKLDTEITTSDKQTKNLILVGGPAVNSLVAELGNAGKHMTLEEYRAEGSGFAIIDYIEDAFATGKAALVVAGHDAADTRTAANILQNYDTKQLSGSEVRIMNGVITTE